MARTAASVEDLEAGTLPPVCAKTGGTAHGFVAVRFTETPSWTWILLLFGIFRFLIAQAFSSTRIVGFVPMSDTALRRGQAFTWAFCGSFLLSGLLTAVGFFTNSTVLLPGLSGLAVTSLITAAGWPFVWPTGRLSGDWVGLSFVDRQFAMALDRWYGDR